MKLTASYLRALLWTDPQVLLATAAYGAWSWSIARRDPQGSRQHAIARRWARRLLAIAGVSVEVRGLENLPATAAVLVANHLSYFDTPVIFAELPMPFRILALEWLFHVPFLGGHLRRAQHIPVDQRDARAAMRSLLRAAGRVRGGEAVFIFPEAHRSPDGQLQPFVSGAFFLALKAQVPVSPMALVGTREILPPNSYHIRPGRVRLLIAPPIATAGRAASEAAALAAEARAAIAALLAGEAHAPPLEISGEPHGQNQP